MRDDKRPERAEDERDTDVRHKQSYDDLPGERPNRDTDNWLETIGPEDMDRDRVVDKLEDYGWDVLEKDEKLSLPTADEGSYVGGYEQGAYVDVVEVGDLEWQNTPVDADQPDTFRPTEDEAFDEITGADDLDDEMPTGDTQPSGVQ